MLAGAGANSGATHKASDEGTEVAFLVHQSTASSLATASLLAHLTQSDSENEGHAEEQPADLIAKAVALAPERPQLLWVQLRDCEQRRCAEEMQIAGKLKTIDPGNGLAWLADLRAAPGFSSPEATAIIGRIGDSQNPRVYWNALVVMMFDALTHTSRSFPATAISQAADDRLTHVTSILAAVDVPIFQPLARACSLDQFDLPGRRPACERTMSRLESSDAVIAQHLSLELQESWASTNSPQREALHRRLLQERYLLEASNRTRGSITNHDAELRVEAMRRLTREEDVELAMLRIFHDPLERPATWRSAGRED